MALSGGEIRAELAALMSRAAQVSQLLASARLILGRAHTMVADATSGSQHPAASGARDLLGSACDLTDEARTHLQAGSASWASYAAHVLGE